MNIKMLLPIISFILISITPATFALDTRPVISLSLAKKMADACEANQVELGYRKVNIAIVDDGANLVLFRRQNNAFLGSIDIALGKAKSSASIPYSTRTISEIVYGKDGKPGRVPGLAHSKNVVAFAGGLPIKTKDGTLIGAIGVSGATGDEDELCAQAAIDAVANELK